MEIEILPDVSGCCVIDENDPVDIVGLSASSGVGKGELCDESKAHNVQQKGLEFECHCFCKAPPVLRAGERPVLAG